jgi:hypothetical protein
MMTRSQLMARLQQLDPSFFPATRQRTQVLQQKHQQLWTLQQQVGTGHFMVQLEVARHQDVFSDRSKILSYLNF